MVFLDGKECPMKALRSVLVVEPSEIIAEGLRVILTENRSFNVLAPLYNADNLEERLPAICPDILIINPTLMASSTRQRLNTIMRLRPSMIVVALVYQYVEPALSDCFRFQLDIRAGRSAIVSLLQSAMAIDEEEETKPIGNYELSDRETDVLVLVAKGLSSKEIAETLHISIHTVNSHRKNITHKTGIKSVAGLAVYAMIHNLME